MAWRWRCRPACVVAVLVDEAVWPWRGARWAHLVSDESVAELHDFAARLGLRRMSFQGDHYDIPAEIRDRALRLGARSVGGRDLVRSLRSANLRLRASERPGRWERIATWEANGRAPDLTGRAPRGLVDALAHCVKADWSTATVTLYRRSTESAVVVADDGGLVMVCSVPKGVEWRCTEGRILELLSEGSDR